MQRKLYTGAFAELQAHFIREVSAQRKRDPLAPLDVAVSGQLVRMALRRELALAGCSHAGIRFRTLTELAREAAGLLLRERKLRPMRDLHRDPLMSRAIATAGPLHYFFRISARPGFRRAVWRTLNDLRSAGLQTADLESWLKRVDARQREAAYDPFGTKLRNLLQIWKRLDELMGEMGLADEIALLDLACAGFGDAASQAPIIFYGLDDLTALERRFCEKLARRADAAVYLPYRAGKACAWVKPLHDFFRSIGFDDVPLDPPPPDGRALSHLKRDLFEEMASTPLGVKVDDDSLRVISVPTREREAEEITRQIVLSPLGEVFVQRRAAVLMRRSESYVRPLRAELAQAGVSGYFHQCRTLGETPTGRALRLLAALLDGRWRRAEVMEFLLVAPLRRPEALPDAPCVVPAAQWNHFSIEAAVTSGEKSWEDGLRRLLALHERAADSDEEDDGRRAADPASVRLMWEYVAHLFAGLDKVNRAHTWAERSAAFLALFEELVETGQHGDVIAEEVAQLAELDALRYPLTAHAFRSQIGEILTRPAEREGRFQHHEPTVATFREALGVLFDEVFVTGLAERETPQPDSQDPLLLDDERAAVSKAILPHVPLPVSARWKERERFLFWCALTSARRRAVLSCPRRDAGQDRERLPSTYLLHVVEALEGRRADYSALDRFLAESPLAHRVRAARLQPAPAEQPVTPFQYDAARLGEALATNSAEPILHLLCEQPFLERAARAENDRFRARDFTPFDGVIARAELREHLREWMATNAFPLSPTAMERYAACPFRYFAERVLGLAAIDEADEILQLQPVDRGSLVHDILHRFYSNERDADRLPLTPSALPRLEEAATAVFARFERFGVTGLPMLWRIEKERMLQWLRALVGREIEEATRFIPAQFEQRFTFTLAGHDDLSFTGKIDRIDENPEGGARVIDYKTGRRPRRPRDDVFSGGRALQLPVYLAAAESTLTLRVEEACYYYLREEATSGVVRFAREDWEQRQGEFVQIARVILRGIASGLFYPRPEAEQCRSCPMIAACGSGRFTPKWEFDPETARDYRSLSRCGT